jgi:hypothetical protein
MRRFFRFIRRALLLVVATCLLTASVAWYRSYRVQDSISYGWSSPLGAPPPVRFLYADVTTEPGAFLFELAFQSCHSPVFVDPGSLGLQRNVTHYVTTPPPAPQDSGWHYQSSGTTSWWRLTCPAWSVVALLTFVEFLLLIPTWRWVRAKRRNGPSGGFPVV